MCYIFNGEDFDALISPDIYLSGSVHYFHNCVFRKGDQFMQ